MVEAPVSRPTVTDAIERIRTVLAYVSRGRSAVGIGTYPDATARRALAELDDVIVPAVAAPAPDRDLAGQFCGQMQPHDAHRWTRSQLTLSLWQFCAGVGGVSAEPQPDHVFQPVAGHPDDDECTHRSDGTDATYCGLPEEVHP